MKSDSELDQILMDLRGYASANRVITTAHARKQMRVRRVKYADLRHALIVMRTCKRSYEQDGSWQGKWEVASCDEEGVPLTLIVVADDGVVVITVMDSRKIKLKNLP